VNADDFDWDVAGPADWNDGNNWTNTTTDPPTPMAGPPSGGGGNFGRVNNGGTAVISSDIPDIQDPFVGSGAGNSGTLNQTGGNTQVDGGTSGWMFVGNEGGTGTYNLSGGVQGKDRLYVGRGTGSVGTLNVSGTGAINNQEVNIGVDGDAGSLATGTATLSGDATVTTTGLIQVSNGSMSVTENAHISGGGEFWVGQGAGRSATLDIDSGNIEAGAWIAIGRDGSTGVVNLSGTGRLAKVTGNDAAFITAGGLGTGNGGTINIQDEAVLESDTNLVLGETAGRYGIVNQSGGTVNVHDNAANTDGFNDSLELDFQGEGLGEYHLSGGALNAETIDATTGVFDMTGGTLSATNFVGNLVQNGGTTSPGNSPGIMLVTGDYSLVSGDLFMEIEGVGAGIGYDQLQVTGDVSLAGDLTLAGAYVPAAGDSFTLIDNQGANAIAGIFTGIAEGSIVSFNGIDLTASYLGGDGNDFVLSNVPEPSTIALVGICLVGFVARRRS